MNRQFELKKHSNFIANFAIILSVVGFIDYTVIFGVIACGIGYYAYRNNQKKKGLIAISIGMVEIILTLIL